LVETSTPPAIGRPCPPHRLATHRLGVRVAFPSIRTASGGIRGEVPRTHALAASGLYSFLRQQPLPPHHRYAPPQPARGRLVLRPLPLAVGGRALCRRGPQALSAPPLHRRSLAPSQSSRLRLLRDEDVPCPLL